MRLCERALCAARGAVASVWLLTLLSFVTTSLCAQTSGHPTGDDAEEVFFSEGKQLQVTSIHVHNYKTYGTADGLCSNAVNCLFKDNDGLLWIGTEDGLNSFDGINIEIFQPREGDTTSIAGKQVLDINQFQKNRVAVALGDGGLVYYDKLRRSFLREDLSQLIENPAERNSTYGLLGYKSTYCAIYPGRVIIFKGDKGVDVVPMSKEKPNDGVRWGKIDMMLMPGSNGKAVLKTGSREINTLDLEAKRDSSHRKHIRNKGAYIYDICPFDNDRVLIATDRGLFRYNINTHDFSALGLLDGKLVYAISRNKDGEFWIAYDGNRIIKWSPMGQSVYNISNSVDMMSVRTKVNDLFEDDNGLLWVATNNSGVIKVDTKAPRVSRIDFDLDIPINYITEDLSAVNSRYLWAACGLAGMAKVDMKERTGTVIKLKHRNVMSILARHDGTVLVGTSNGAFRYHEDTGVLDTIGFLQPRTEGAKFNSTIVRHMREDRRGNVWFSTNKGLFRFNGAEHEKFTVNGTNVFNCAMEDDDSRIWAGASDGLWVRGVQGEDFRLAGLHTQASNEDGVLCMGEYREWIFVGSTAGLCIFDKRTEKMVDESKVPFISTFRNITVYSIACERDGIVWLNTSAGIGYIDINYGNVYNFGISDGLFLEGNDCKDFVFVDDMLYFGQITAVNTIKTSEITFNTRMPKTIVSKVLYGPSGYEEEIAMVDDSTFRTRYQTNSAPRVYIASSDFTDPKRNLFKYKIGDGRWQNTTDPYILLDQPIQSGSNYKVSILCTNGDKTWSYDVKTIYVVIEPQIFLSVPFLIIYAILFVVAVWFSLNMRFRSINRRLEQAKRERTEKMRAEEQKRRLEHAIGEQRASLSYAKRIQDALMPRVSSMYEYMAKFFVLYKPKEIVSGDFYTFYHRDGKSFIVSADCTGHGVPGAFISILGLDHLDNIIMQQKIDDAGEILDHLHSELHDAVRKLASEDFNDGMDMTICVVDHANKTLNFAGAMNNLVIIRDNTVLLYRGDRRSIGGRLFVEPKAVDKFTSQVVQCNSGDMMYMFSDGFADQFGGPEKKKFAFRRFRNLLLNVHRLSPHDQRVLLNQKLEEWKGTDEQTDDISVIGFMPWA